MSPRVRQLRAILENWIRRQLKQKHGSDHHEREAARLRGFEAASSFAAAAFAASSASLAKRSDRSRIVLVAAAARASASGLTNLAMSKTAILRVRKGRPQWKVRGRNRIAGNRSVRSRPLAPLRPTQRIAIASDAPRGAASRHIYPSLRSLQTSRVRSQTLRARVDGLLIEHYRGELGGIFV